MKAQGGFKRQAGKGSAEERLMGQCRRERGDEKEEEEEEEEEEEGYESVVSPTRSLCTRQSQTLG